MPVVSPPFVSGIIITVRLSLRPRTTRTSCSLATRRLVPTSCALRSTREARFFDIPPRSTIVIVPEVPVTSPSMAYRVKPVTELTAASRSATIFKTLYESRSRATPASNRALTKGRSNKPSSLREIPTVTVFA